MRCGCCIACPHNNVHHTRRCTRISNGGDKTEKGVTAHLTLLSDTKGFRLFFGVLRVHSGSVCFCFAMLYRNKQTYYKESTRNRKYKCTLRINSGRKMSFDTNRPSRKTSTVNLCCKKNNTKTEETNHYYRLPQQTAEPSRKQVCYVGLQQPRWVETLSLEWSQTRCSWGWNTVNTCRF